MKEFFKLNLQFFAGEGAGANGSGAASSGEGVGQASGVDATAAAEQRLRELGVPEGKAKQRASKVASRTPAAEVKSTPNTATAAVKEHTPTEEKDANVSQRLTWDDIKRDPEYKKAYDSDMQKAITSRLKNKRGESQAAKDALEAMTPAIELMARKYGLDSKNMDYKALADAINNDDAYYEQKALEMGTSIETAKRVDQMERDEARRKEAEQRSFQEQKMRNHFIKLEEQSQAVKAVFPKFDLRTELQNPAFARMVAPDSPFSVEDAYHAVHRKEIQAAQMQYAAQKTAENLSNAIMAGQKRPDEAGTSSQAPSVSAFDYRNASREQRQALKNRIRRGEKVYPT